MLLKNARVENKDGIRFFEKDILIDDYLFSNDIEIKAVIDYVTPGFGIVLMDNGGDSSIERSNSYLFKIGYKQIAIYHSGAGFQKVEKQISSHKIKTITEGMVFVLKKLGKKIMIYIDGELAIEHFIKNDLLRYNVGYYSNQGNVIKSINIKSATPNKWNINMGNTNGGYIRFLDDEIELDDCIQDAEVEQQGILLKGGEHYINYTKSKGSDIKVYVHRSDDDRLYDKEKDITKDGRIRLVEDTLVNLKIVGRKGSIKDIFISSIKDDDYVSTGDNNIEFSGSYLDIYIKGLKKVTWKGNIKKIPNFILDNKVDEYFTVSDSKTKIKPEHTNISIGNSDKNKYEYSFNCETHLFKISRGREVIYTKTLKDITNKITVFKNLSAVISELVLYKVTGEIINVNIQNENKQSINADIDSPIIVTDKYSYPLDLSSSYRVDHKDGDYQYVYTNWEREIFECKRIIKFEKPVSKEDDSMIIYGIKNGAKFDIRKIYDIENGNINSIDKFTRYYDRLSSRETILNYNANTREVILDKSIESKYSYLIIDYLKMNSYCINYRYETNAYMVDISTEEDKFKVLYNSKQISDSAYEVNKYKCTNISGNGSGYIVLRKGV